MVYTEYSSEEMLTAIQAAGNVGSVIVPVLLNSGFNVSALTRESSDSTFPEGVRVIKTDYSHDSLKAALSGQDAVICTLSVEAFGLQIDIIKAAEEVGVKRFIPSEFGNLRNKKSIDEFERVLQMKATTMEFLQQRAAENKSFTWTGLATGVFLDWVRYRYYD
jgi:putative NADH-flavin reductase